jgi:hypothetical protein
MSESYSETSLNKQIEQLDASVSDPYIQRAIKLAQEFNKLFEEISPTKQERDDIIDEIEEQWGDLNKMQVSLCGWISTQNEYGDIVKSYHEDVCAVSNGFIMDDVDLFQDGQLLTTKAAIKHHVFIKSRDLNLEGEDDTWVGATADLDEIIIDVPSVSFERATAWLAVNYPEFIDEVDQRILNAQGTEADAIIALQGLDIPVEFTESELAVNSISAYLREIIQLDRVVPYSVRIKGETHVVGEDQVFQRGIIDSGAILADLVSISVDVYDRKVSNKPELFIFMKTAMSDRLALPLRLDVPITSIMALMSIRSAYYDDV